ncbi:MAG: S-layer homology domain-containing protein [Ruminococcaceae bacterium]|nr:S-layer homology domain-containing protein [Oscillospiraceae bacterium]
MKKSKKILSAVLALVMVLSCLSVLAFSSSAASVNNAVKADIINVDIDDDMFKKLPEDICNSSVSSGNSKRIGDNVTVFNNVITTDDENFISKENIVINNLPDNYEITDIYLNDIYQIDGKYYYRFQYTDTDSGSKYNYAYAYTEDFVEFFFFDPDELPVSTDNSYTPGNKYRFAGKPLTYINEINGKHYFYYEWDWTEGQENSGNILYTTDFENFTEVEVPAMGCNMYIPKIGSPQLCYASAEDGYIVYNNIQSDLGLAYMTYDRLPPDYYYTEDFVNYTKVDASALSGFYGSYAQNGKELNFRFRNTEASGTNGLFMTVWSTNLTVKEYYSNSENNPSDVEYLDTMTYSYIFDKDTVSFVKSSEINRDSGVNYLTKNCTLYGCFNKLGEKKREYMYLINNGKETVIDIKDLKCKTFTFNYDSDEATGNVVFNYIMGTTNDGTLFFTKDFKTIVNYALPISKGERIDGFIFTALGNRILSTYIEIEPRDYIYYNYLIYKDKIKADAEAILKDYYKGFPDVANGTWYYDAVKYCNQHQFINGYQNGTFGPNNALQRQDFVVILANIAGADLSGYTSCKLKDVDINAYYGKAVAWAVDKGIIAGYQNGKFGVGDPINREQVATILYRYMKNPAVSDVDGKLAKFPDKGNISEFAKAPLAWAVENNIISGMQDGTVAPKGTAVRAQIASIIMRMDQNGMFNA